MPRPSSRLLLSACTRRPHAALQQPPPCSDPSLLRPPQLQRRPLSQQPRSSAGATAIAFDIDGVLIRGKELIPQAREALHMIAPKEWGGKGLAHLPFCFLTNGGGVSEARKAEELSSWFGLSIPPSLVCLSHTPMRALLPTLQHSRILVLGMTDVASVATSYGFTDVVTMADIAVQHPHLVPHLTHSEPGGHSIHTPTPSPPSPHPPSPPIDLASIRAIFVMHDPNAWYRDMQLLIDVLTASTTPPPLYFTNPDFLFTGKAAKPRLAQGAFRVGLEAMWKEYTGGAQLPYQLMGKPEIVTFRWAERMLSDRAKEMGFARVDERIMVGDNPAADIRGGNRAGWETTILVETGTIERSNRKEDQPTMVAANVLEAVKLAIDKDWRRRESS